jgi:hypothetical protein
MEGFLFDGEIILDRSQFEGASMPTAFSAFTTATAIAGVATLAFAGYVLFASLPDLRRYIRISTM